MAERSEAPDRIPRGVGTKLVTAYDQPALGGVHKLGAMQNDAGQWQPRLKLSEQAIKTSTPGMLQIRRPEEGIDLPEGMDDGYGSGGGAVQPKKGQKGQNRKKQGKKGQPKQKRQQPKK